MSDNTSNGSRPVHGRGLILPAPAPPAPGDDEPDDDEWDDTEPAVMAHGRGLTLPAPPAGDDGPTSLRLIPAEEPEPGGDRFEPKLVLVDGELVSDRGGVDLGWTRDLERLADSPRPVFIVDI